MHIYFEDEFLAIIHKPAGIIVSGNKHKTISNALPYVLEKGSIDFFNPEPVHRLDYETSGLLLCGKTRDSIKALGKKFSEGSIDKTYIALCIGKLVHAKGIMEDSIDGKKSLTEYKVLKSFPSEKYGDLSLLKLSPKTGRKHQIRKHLYNAQHPILGDKKYFMENLISFGNGLYLHAYKLKFKHPFKDEIVSINSEIPNKFENFVQDLKL